MKLTRRSLSGSILLLLFALILSFMMTSCTKKSNQQLSNEMKIYVPSAPPAIPIYKSAETLKNLTVHQYTDVASEALPALIKGEAALFVLPTNVALKLHNKTGNVVLISVLSSGMIQLISSDPTIVSIEDLRGKPLSIPAPGSSPDVIGRYLLKKKGVSPEITYGSSPEIAKLLIAGKIQNAILPEPLASSVLFKGSNTAMHKVSDLREEWLKAHPDTRGIPQVGICCTIEYYESRPQEIGAFISSLRESVDWTNNNYEEAALIGKEKISLAIPENVIAESITSMNLTCRTAKESRTDLEVYFEALYSMDPKTVGGKKAEESFFIF